MTLPDGARLVDLAPGVPCLELDGPLCRARVSLLGGQLLSFVPAGGDEWLYLSPDAVCQPGKAIRGGVPVCWPWFGAHPDDATAPAHGTVRGALWTLDAVERHADGAWRVALSAPPHGGLGAGLQLSLGRDVGMELVTRNTADQPRPLSCALHGYFRVGDVRELAITGLAGCAYDDKVDGGARREQSATLTLVAETDRIYYDVPALTLIDGARRLAISGGASVVLWNPWADKAARLADLPDADWTRFICVEAALAGRAARLLAAGEEARLAQRIAVTV